MEANGEPTYLAGERLQLEEFLDSQRAELIDAVRGLSDEQARRRLVPSLTTPLGLLKHAAFAEQVWFHVALAGRSREDVGIPATVDESFAVHDTDTVAAAIADYARVCEEARAIAAGHALDDVARNNRRGELNLRWIYVHMIEELARHAGHADILAEQIRAQDSAAQDSQG